jgi:hypothetical protein
VVKFGLKARKEWKRFFSLPLHTKNKGKVANEQNSKNERRIAPNKEKIKMIADDDIISRKLILKSVHEFAKEIIEAKTGREAIEREHKC